MDREEIAERLARIETTLEHQECYNIKLDEMHKILTGNGEEGFFDQVRLNTRFRKVINKFLFTLFIGLFIEIISAIVIAMVII